MILQFFLKGLFLASIIFTSTTLFAVEKCLPSQQIPSEKQISALFNEWNTALQTQNPDTVVAEYAKNAVLLPTLSNVPRTNHAQIRAYFVDFLKNHPVATVNSQVINAGCNWASDTGIYTFKLKMPNGKTKSTQARFSFVYERINDKWLIVSHHSSLMPEDDDEEDDDD